MANRISPSVIPNPVTPLGYDGTDFKALKVDADGLLSVKIAGYVPEAHAASHQDGGSDEISVTGLSGELADNQKSTFLKLSDTPATFVGQANKVPYVVTAENALAFALFCDLDGLLKMFRSRRFMLCDFQSYDYWTNVVTGTGSVVVGVHNHTIATGATSGSTATGYMTTGAFAMTCAEFTVFGRINTVVDSNTIWVVMTTGTAVGLTAVHMGWYILNGRVWASNGDGAAGKQTDTGIDLEGAVFRSLRVISNSSIPDIKFYVDDVLKATHTVNLPAYPGHRPLFYILNSTAATRSWRTNQVFYRALDDLV